MPYASKAQQGYMHAAAARGDISKKVVKDFDRATTSKQYAHLPEHVEHDAKGGFAGRLVKRYFGGGRAGLHHGGSEHDEKSGSYMSESGHEVCQHFAHGGEAEEHTPNCYDHPDNPMYRGGLSDDSRQDVGEPEAEFERDEEKDVDEYPRGGELRGMAQGGEAEELEQHLEGADWQDDERNRKRSPLAERLSGARMKPDVLSRLLRKPGSRVP